MNEAVIREKLMEIAETIETTGEAKAEQVSSSQGIYVSDKKLKVEDVVDQLRLNIKYLLFDLEASRRENRYLRQMLEMRPPQSGGSRNDDNDPNTGWK
jgi:hypothetical protein